MTRRSAWALAGLALVLVVVAALLQLTGSPGQANPAPVTAVRSAVATAPVTVVRSSGAAASSGAAKAAVDPQTGLRWIDQNALPARAQEILALIDKGGPFPYPGKDGSTFGNVERLLPTKPGGYYTEYTVVAPKAQDRGPVRIIVGGSTDFFYTADHYASFERIRR